jgi:phage recombination protein Bet
MSNEIVTTQGQGLISYNKEQLSLIKEMYAKKATDTELQLLLYMSNRYGLDILTKQIWCVKFGDAAAQIYAGRDGFLEVGHRSNQFDGMETKIKRIDEPISIEYSAWENRVKVNKTFKSDYQFVATCTVYRKDMEHPIEVEVYEEEYSTGQSLWQTKRRTMIGKVAESQALRKAFSISGLYAEEEIYQEKVEIDENKPTTEEVVEADVIINSVIDKNKVDAIIALAKRKGINQKSICTKFKLNSFEEMTIVEWSSAMDNLNLRPDKKANPLEGVI